MAVNLSGTSKDQPSKPEDDLQTPAGGEKTVPLRPEDIAIALKTLADDLEESSVDEIAPLRDLGLDAGFER
ncbi:hypothetical protein AGIG_G14531 [Arapaima gigas]